MSWRSATESFKRPTFVSLLRAHGVAAVLADSDTFPAIPDVTAPFVYARLQRTSEAVETGYPDDALEAWAERARTWARGGVPPDRAGSTPSRKRSRRRAMCSST